MIEAFFLRIKRRIQKKKFMKFGACSYIHYSSRVKNPQYIRVGENVYIADNGIVEAWDEYNDKRYTPCITIGSGTMINSYCHIGATNKITIGNDCLFGSHVMIIDHAHGNNSLAECNIHPAKRDLYSKGEIVIGDRVWVGENAVILPGVKVGKESIIGANAVVTKDVPERCIVAGNPAKIMRFLKNS